MAAYFSAVGFDAAGEPAGDMLAPHMVQERLAALTTPQLEARLARFHAVLLTVRAAPALAAGVWRTRRLCAPPGLAPRQLLSMRLPR